MRANRERERGRGTFLLSPCHLVTLSPCHLVTLSPCHLVTLSPCHLVTLSPCHLVTLSPCHLTRHLLRVDPCPDHRPVCAVQTEVRHHLAARARLRADAFD